MLQSFSKDTPSNNINSKFSHFNFKVKNMDLKITY